MECAYYFGWTAHGMCLLLWVDGTWNVPTTLTFVGCVDKTQISSTIVRLTKFRESTFYSAKGAISKQRSRERKGTLFVR
jgi:hypothetical protein